ncbi:MAG: TonB-dependent receptor [Flavobacteriales bacterium]|nr:TonB-dependent receptor [Flavobacteriales bacterium]|tara:strand:- start:2735 stop:4963 length:2229 start_codon:yes stop_codon:yes gene_type:complete
MIRFFILLIIPLFSTSQDYLRGKIVDSSFNPLSNATAHWINTESGTMSDVNGEFKISKKNIIDKRLIISFIGFESDTILIDQNTNSIIRSLTKNTNLTTIKLVDNAKNTYIDNNNPVKIEIITEKELTKAACCDLAGCFETQLSVESKTTNIITNTKELSILGLSGVYNQILIDGLPLIKGLNYTYGVSSIPGTLIKNIHISQGLASVLQGPESLSGQINISLKDYEQNDTLLFNMYRNNFSTQQANLNYNFKIGKWKSLISLHTTQPGKKIDHNKDGFLDIPLTQKNSFYSKSSYQSINKKLYTSISLRYLNESRVGGEFNFTPNLHMGGSEVYGQVISFEQPEIYQKLSYKINTKNDFLFEYFYSTHKQNSFFGNREYLANQNTYYANISLIKEWNNNKLSYGLSNRKLKLNETISSTINNKIDFEELKDENISGFFIENNFKWDKKAELILGLRLDYHNEFDFFVTPRTLLKYNLSENTFLRASAGKGWKTINTYSEHINLLAYNQDIDIDSDLQPEEAWNFGVNLLHAIYKEDAEFQIILDFYKTIFKNYMFIDYHGADHNEYSNYNTIHVVSSQNKKTSNSFQAEIGIELFNSLGLKFAYNYLNVFRVNESGKKEELPFNSKHHVLSTISYQPINKSWQIDINAHIFGPKKLIYNEENIIDHHNENFSSTYTILNAQITQKMDRIEVYFGAENILNFIQKDPIINAHQPFDPGFDSSHGVWGPTKGIEAYIGLRFKI